MLAPWKKGYGKHRQHIKKQRHYFANKDQSSQSYGFSSSHVWMWELGYKEKLSAKELMLLKCGFGEDSFFGEDSWVPSTARRSNQSILKEISPKYCLEGLMLYLKLHYFGHLMRRTDSLGKALMLGKTEGRRRRGRQDEMVGWHHWLHGHEFEHALGVGDGQESLVCYSSWGGKESDTTERWNDWVFMGLSRQVFWSALLFPSPVEHVLSELSTMTHPSWVAHLAWLIVSLS